MTFDGELSQHLDMLLAADLFGRDQQLTLDQAIERLRQSIDERTQKLYETEGTQEEQYWLYMGYRSVAYDFAGLITTLLREYPDSAVRIADAHRRLWHSMIHNDFAPDTGELWITLTELRDGK